MSRNLWTFKSHLSTNRKTEVRTAEGKGGGGGSEDNEKRGKGKGKTDNTIYLFNI